MRGANIERRVGSYAIFEHPVKKLVGIVQTENPEDAGRVIFTLLLSNGVSVPCRSGAAYKSAKPRKGDKVAIIGDTILDLMTQAESREFFFSSLQILSVAAPVTESDPSLALGALPN